MGGEEEGVNKRERVRAREAIMVFEKVGEKPWGKRVSVLRGTGTARDSETNP